jgi:hypothetical protein
MNIERLAGAAGFEPAHGGTKNRCLTAWLRPSRAAPYSGRIGLVKGRHAASIVANTGDAEPNCGANRAAIACVHRRHIPQRMTGSCHRKVRDRRSFYLTPKQTPLGDLNNHLDTRSRETSDPTPPINHSTSPQVLRAIGLDPWKDHMPSVGPCQCRCRMPEQCRHRWYLGSPDPHPASGSY